MWFLAILFSFVVCVLVGLSGHSGQHRPPMFGDFEAQRHWMEVTINLPLGDWYRQTQANDLQYWGLDYPPLTAYVSWLCGKIAMFFVPDLVQLHTSRGLEHVNARIFMRLTVLVADLAVFMPAVVVVACRQFTLKKQSSFVFFIFLLTSMLSPALVLIDHGHFQYNGVCIGLSLFAAALLHNNSNNNSSNGAHQEWKLDVLCSIAFCLSLNFKQMSLYYAPFFFCVLLRKCWLCSYEGHGEGKNPSTWHLRSRYLFVIGSTVISTFALLWAPFCLFPGGGGGVGVGVGGENNTSDEGVPSCLSSLTHVLTRQFPFARGIFEDKVSNVWYVMSVLVDFRR